MNNTWREVGTEVEQWGGEKRWSVQVWEIASPSNPGRRIVAVDFCYTDPRKVGLQRVHHLISQSMTVVEALQFAACLFEVPVLWRSLDFKNEEDLSEEDRITMAIEKALPEGWLCPTYTLSETWHGTCS